MVAHVIPRTPCLFYCVGFTRAIYSRKNKNTFSRTRDLRQLCQLCHLSRPSFHGQSVPSPWCYICQCSAVLQVFSQFFFLWGVNFILHRFGLFPTSPCKQEYFWRKLCVNAFLSCFFFRECFQKCPIKENAVSVKTAPKLKLIRPIFPSSLVNSVQSIVGVSVCS